MGAAPSARRIYLVRYNAMRKARNRINRAVPGAAKYALGTVTPTGSDDRGFTWKIGFNIIGPASNGETFGYSWVSIQFGEDRYFFTDSFTAKNPHGRFKDGLKMLIGLELQAREQLTVAA